MKTLTLRSLLIRGAVAALMLQVVSVASAQSRGSNNVPSSVLRLDSAAHELVDSYQRSLRKDYHKHSSYRAEKRFLDAAKAVEGRAHALRENVDARRGSERVAQDISSLRRAYSYLNDSARGVRLSDRVRADLYRVRSAVSDVENDRRAIYAMSTPGRGRDHHHDHDHDHRRDDDRPRLPGILGKIFGN